MSSPYITRVLAALGSSIVLLTLPALAADRLNVGQYALITTKDGETRKLSRCVTPEEARTANADDEAGRKATEKLAEGYCTVTDYVVDGNTVTIGMACGEDLSTTRTTYHGDSWSAETTNTLHENGKVVVHTMHSEAKRVGDCE